MEATIIKERGAFSIPTAAEYLEVSLDTARRSVKDGALRAFSVNTKSGAKKNAKCRKAALRILRSDLESFIQQRMAEQAARTA